MSRINELIQKCDELESIFRNMKEGKRRVCQYQFKKHDIVWICRQCQKDETFVLCNGCWINSDHTGHEIYFYHSNSDGCCDCGDVECWDPSGFCGKHGNCYVDDDPLSEISKESIESIEPLLSAIANGIADYVTKYSSLFDMDDTMDNNRKLIQSFAINSEGTVDQVAYGLLLCSSDEYDEFAYISYLSSALATAAISIAPYSAETPYPLPTSDPDLSWNDYFANIYTAVEEHGNHVVFDCLFLNTFEDVYKVVSLLNDAYRVRCATTTSAIVKYEDEMINILARLHKCLNISDAVARLIANSFNFTIVAQLLSCDFKVSHRLLKVLHDFYLQLMADASFKQTLSSAYAYTYHTISSDYGEMSSSTAASSIFSLSVQFINRDMYLSKMIADHDFLRQICKALEAILCVKKDYLSLTSNVCDIDITRYHILSNRKYSAIICDVKTLLSLTKVSRLFLYQNLHTFLNILCCYQCMHRQAREMHIHVDTESNEWMTAFTIYLNIAALFNPLLKWIAAGVDAVHADGNSYNANELTVATLIQHVVDTIMNWNKKYMILHHRQQHQHGTNRSLWSSMVDIDTIDHRKISVIHIPDTVSFHMPLYHFFTHIILQCCQHTDYYTALRCVGEYINRFNTKFDHYFMIDMCIHCLSVSSQIICGMWRRNGDIMLDQVRNYSSYPSIREYKDMDILLLQFMASFDCNDSSSSGLCDIVCRVFYRYGVLDCVLHPQVPMQANDPISDYKNSLIDEALQLLTVLVTDLPISPVIDPHARTRMLVRRDLIHQLAGGIDTHHELHAMVMSNSLYYGSIDTTDVDDIIRDISDVRYVYSNLVESSRLVLKRACWSEYDPCYTGLTKCKHQLLVGSRPPVCSVSPIVIAPYILAHPLFVSLRVHVLLSDVLLTMILNLLYSYAAERCSTSSSCGSCGGSYSSSVKYHFCQSMDWSLVCDETIFIRCLQMVTLSVHVSVDGNNTVSYRDLIDAYARLLVRTTDNHPHLIETIMDIADALDTSDDNNSRHWVEWILLTVSDVSVEVAEYISNRHAVTTSAKKKVELEERKKSARLRAMQSIQRSIDAFAETIGIEDTSIVSSSIGNTDGNAMSGDGVDDSNADGEDMCMKKQKDSNDQCCIICQSASPKDLLCYQAYAQRSNTLSHSRWPISDSDSTSDSTSDSLHIDTVSVKSDDRQSPVVAVDVDGHSDACIHLSFCDHVMHASCYETYFASISLRHYQSNLLLDVLAGDYPCPLCKHLNNTLVPVPVPVPVSAVAVAGVGVAGVCASNSDVDPCTWLDTQVHRSTSIMTPLYYTSEVTIASVDATKLNRYYRCINDLTLCRGATLDVTSIMGNYDSFAYVLIERQILPAIAAAAYTISVDEIESERPGYHLDKCYSGIDDVSKIDSVVYCIGKCIDSFQCRCIIEAYTILAITGSMSQRNESIGVMGKCWLSLPLLDMPLYDCVVLHITLNAGRAKDGSDSTGSISSLPWICIAKLVQLVQQCLVQEESSSSSSSISSSARDSDTIDNPIACTYGEQLLHKLIVDVVAAHTSSLTAASATEAKVPVSISATKVTRILMAWISFLRAVIHAVCRCTTGSISHEQVSLLHTYADRFNDAHESAEAHAAILGVSHLIESRYDYTVTTIRAWITDYTYSHDNASSSGSTCYYPAVYRCKLFAICDSYTTLHSRVTSIVEYELPGICLKCGAIIEAKGNGNCKKHLQSCCTGTGIVLLLHDSLILLSHNGKCVCMASPYVDQYNENHCYYRGKPLTLNVDRLETLRCLYSKNKIANEVFSKRSSSSNGRVIINGYY